MKQIQFLLYAAAVAVITSGCASDAASIGVIGGSDGPTSIIVSHSLLLPRISWVVGGILVLALIGGFLMWNRPK